MNNECKIATIFLAGILSLGFLWAGAEVYAQSEEGDIDALIAAAGSGDLKAVKASIDGGIPVDAKDSLGVTALMEASYAGKLRVVEFLLERGANASAKDEAGTSPLLEALGKDHADVALALINAGADPNVRNGEDHTALYQAVEIGRLDLIKAAITGGAEVNPMTGGKPDENSRFNPLLLAVKNDNIAAARALLAAGADPNIPKKFAIVFRTVSVATGQKNKKMVPLLLNAGAQPNPYVMAYAVKADPKLLSKLLKDPAARSRDALGLALATAIKRKNRKAINELINSGADINGRASGADVFLSYGLPLVAAVKVGDAKIVRQLIRAGADANKTGPGGLLPATYAAQSGRADLLKLLAGAGADLEKAMEQVGYSTPDELRHLTFEELVSSPEWTGPMRLLIKFGAPVEYAIISAVQAGNSALVREWLPLIKNWGVSDGRIFQTSEIYFSLVGSADIAENCAMAREIKQMFQRRTGLKPPQGTYFPKCK